MKKYTSTNPRLSDKDARVIGRFIDTAFNGKVTAKELLAAAKPKNSPIHGFFEWDDTKAAEAHRLSQARSLIVSIYVETDDHKPVRSFLNVRLDDGKTYLNCDSVAQDADLIDQVIESAKDQLLRWKDRYQQYMDFFKLEFQTKGKKHVIQKEDRAN